MGAAKPWVKAGSAGRYRSVVMGCKPKSSDKTTITQAGDLFKRSGAGEDRGKIGINLSVAEQKTTLGTAGRTRYFS